jgi:hypothetical protein
MGFRLALRSKTVRYPLGIAAFILSVLAFALAATLFIGVIISMFSGDYGKSGSDNGIMTVYGPLFLIGTAAAWWSLGRRLCREQAPVDAKTPLVLYLRAFKQDRGLFNKYVAWLTIFEATTVEERLIDALKSMGFRTVAIGDPRRLVEFGSDKLYAEGDWHETVKELAARATFIIIRIGVTEGILWELTKLIETADPRRLLLLNPLREQSFDDRNRNKNYLRFREMTVHLFPIPLPPEMGQNELIYFEAGWSPRMHEVGTVLTRRRKHQMWSAVELSRCLRPLFDTALRSLAADRPADS